MPAEMPPLRRLILPLTFGLAGFAVLAGLGLWQVQRLHWKEGELARIDAKVASQPVELPAHPADPGDRWLPVAVQGTFTGPELQVLVSSKDYGAGVRIIAAFRTTAGRTILIDRGFLAEDDRAAHHAPADATDAAPVQVTGNLHWPDEVDSYTPPPDAKTGLWFARDVPAMAAKLGTEPVMVVARSDTGEKIRPMPVDSSAIPNNHLGYAVQWFGLAAVWAGMTLFYLWRQRRRTI